MTLNPVPHIMLVAGEPSGDLLGARLMAALTRLHTGTINFSGVGGPAMADMGLASLFPMSDLSVMGLAEVLPRVPLLKKHLEKTAQHALNRKPDVIVTIDSPGFNFRLAKRLKGKGMPLVHYVAPSVWAWRPGRAAKVAAFLDHLLALLPIEPHFFEEHGLPCHFVGHPVVETAGAPNTDKAGLREKLGIPEEAKVLCILPGSRQSEINRLLPIFGETVQKMSERYSGLQVVLPTVAPLAQRVKDEVATWQLGGGGNVHVVEGEALKNAAFGISHLALAASGTVTLELAMAGVPTVVAYRVHPVTEFVGRIALLVNHVSLVNILLEREVIPEYLHGRCRAGNLVPALIGLWEDDGARAAQIEGMNEALVLLGNENDVPPSERAAKIVLAVLEDKRGDMNG